MSNTTASRSELSVLHSLVAKHLIKKFEDGSAETKDVAAATKFLKDNGVEAAYEADNEALRDVEDALKDYAAGENIIPMPSAG